VAYNFQIGSNRIKLLTEYESVTQKVLFGNTVLAALMPWVALSYSVSSSILLFPVWKIIGHGNCDNNLESARQTESLKLEFVSKKKPARSGFWFSSWKSLESCFVVLTDEPSKFGDNIRSLIDRQHKRQASVTLVILLVSERNWERAKS
jgi:hypothetical protein